MSHTVPTRIHGRESTKYLGVTLTKDLTWGKHVDNIRAKANQQLAFVRRNIRTRSSSTKEKLYNTLVRPHIEYAATVWDPHCRTSRNRSIHLRWSNEELRDGSQGHFMVLVKWYQKTKCLNLSKIPIGSQLT